jgi:hypothetical protein
MIDMSKYGKRWICQKCGARFYDLNKPEPICPKCGHNQLLDSDPDEDFLEEEEEEKDEVLAEEEDLELDDKEPITEDADAGEEEEEAAEEF